MKEHAMTTTSSVDLTIRDISTGAASGSTCAATLLAAPWDIDRVPDSYGPGASMDDPVPADAPRQGEIPREYREASEAELDRRIRAAKAELGERVVVLGHFYQRDEVVQYADYVGDSFQLAKAATAHQEAEAIIFCGVHFMAETADLLSAPEQAVILPNLAAGCSMADMADIDHVEECWEQLMEVYGEGETADSEAGADGLAPIIPVTYMNSSAAIKGFVGRHGGIVCTSSNASAVLQWAFERGRRVLFFPDQHLGRNTAKAMGIPLEQMPMWNPRRPLGGNDEQTLREAQVVLWHGFCSVHQRFPTGQIDQARRAIEGATEPTTFAIGTEINLVQRLAAQHPQHTIFCLDPVICPCSTMYRIHPGYLAWVLESLLEGEVINRISVGQDVAEPARLALERMLAVKPAAPGPAAGRGGWRPSCTPTCSWSDPGSPD